MAQFICDNRGVSEVQNATLADPDPWMWEAFGVVQNDSPVPVTPRSILGHPPIWQGINILAGDCAYMPRMLKRRLANDRTREERNHVAYRLVSKRANPIMLADTFLELMVMRAHVYGNSIAEIARDGNGMPLPARQGGLTPLIPEKTKPEYDENGKLWIKTRVQIRGREEQRFIDPIDTIHFRGLSSDGFWGLSLREVAANTIGYGLGLQKHGNVTFKNRARPDIIATTTRSLTQDAADRLRQNWAAMHQGLDNTARLAILEEGMQVTPFGQSNEDAQWIEAQQFDVQQVARILDLPSPMINDLSRATFSNIFELRLWYVNGRLYKLQRRITGEFEAKLLTEREQNNLFFSFDNDALVRGNLKERYEAKNSAIASMWLTRNEVRIEEGYDPIDGLDEIVNPNTTSGRDEPREPPEDRLATIEERQAKLLAAHVKGCVLREHKKIASAARTEKNFVGWLSEFYETEWPSTLSEVLSPTTAYEYCNHRQQYWVTATGSVYDSTQLTDLVEAKTSCVQDNIRQILNLELNPCVQNTDLSPST